MNRLHDFRLALPVLISFSLIFSLLSAATPALAASIPSTGHEVELNLRVLRDSGSDAYEQYRVELRKSSGELVQTTRAWSGGTVHFKHLKPYIYLICVQGDEGYKQCKSFDMFPPQGSKNYRFNEEIPSPVPLLNRMNAHTVSLRQLRTPEKAKHELVHSVQAAQRGDSSGEIAHLQRAVEIDPNYVDALTNLGCYYRYTRNYALSIQYLSKVTELDPDSRTGWANLGGVLLLTGQWEEGYKAALRGLALWPDNPLSNTQAALCLFNLQRYSDAEKYFKRVLQLDPACAVFPMLFLSRIAVQYNRLEEAEAYLGTFQKWHPNLPNAQFWVDGIRGLKAKAASKNPAIASQKPGR